MGLIYKPFGILLGIVAALLGKRVFNFAWTKVDDQEPPEATTEQTTWARLLTAAAVQGVIFKVVRVVVDRYGAIGWRYLTGVWPGEKRPDRLTAAELEPERRTAGSGPGPVRPGDPGHPQDLTAGGHHRPGGPLPPRDPRFLHAADHQPRPDTA